MTKTHEKIGMNSALVLMRVELKLVYYLSAYLGRWIFKLRYYLNIRELGQEVIRNVKDATFQSVNFIIRKTVAEFLLFLFLGTQSTSPVYEMHQVLH